MFEPGVGGWHKGRVVGHDASRLAIALPEATADEVAAALDGAGWTLLVPEAGDRLARALADRGWTAEPAALYTLAADAELPDDDGAIVITADARGEAFGHLDPALREELMRTTGPVVAALVDGVAAAFAHAPWRTGRWFELAADTVPAYRQLGLASRVAAGLIRIEREAGRQPVMGALDVSLAAQRLARRLGMTPTVRMHVCWPPD
jgi:hypothetical protein